MLRQHIRVPFNERLQTKHGGNPGSSSQTHRFRLGAPIKQIGHKFRERRCLMVLQQKPI